MTVIAGIWLALPSSHKSRSIILSGMLPRAYGTWRPRPARCRTDTENLDEKIPSDTAFCVWFGRTLEITPRKLTQKIKTGTPCQCVI